jgi:hypothetical protein
MPVFEHDPGATPTRRTVARKQIASVGLVVPLRSGLDKADRCVYGDTRFPQKNQTASRGRPALRADGQGLTLPIHETDRRETN